MLLQDLRYGLRMLGKHPGFTLTAILTLALGIGANTAIFSVVNATLLRPLPFHDPDRLVTVWSTAPQLGYSQAPFAYGNFVDVAEQNGVFDHIGAWVEWGSTFNLAGDEPEQVPGAYVSPGLFAVLGVSPAIGRALLPEDHQPNGRRVVLLSHGLRQRRFGSDPGAVGSELTVESRTYTVIGVRQRTHEIGIRVALGAQKSEVMKLVLGKGMILTVIGVAVGLVGTMAISGMMSRLLYGVSPTDPPTLVMISLVLTGTALMASYLPARRAATVDPLVALRYE